MTAEGMTKAASPHTQSVQEIKPAQVEKFGQPEQIMNNRLDQLVLKTINQQA